MQVSTTISGGMRDRVCSSAQRLRRRQTAPRLPGAVATAAAPGVMRNPQESHLAHTTRDPRRVRRAPSQPAGSYNILLRYLWKWLWPYSVRESLSNSICIIVFVVLVEFFKT